jgi:TonB family protein
MALSPSREPFGHGADPGPTRGPAVPVLVVTTDDALWARVSAGIPGLKLEQYDDPDDLVERWNASRPAVVLVDARGIDLARAVERLQTHSVGLVPVAYVDEQTLPFATALERRKALYDHVTSALDPGTTLATFERAGEEALARSALVPPGVSLSITGPRPRAPAGGRPKAVYIGAAAALACVVAAAAVWFARPPATAPAARPAAGTGSVPAASRDPAAGVTASADADGAAGVPVEEVEQRLARARAAMRDKRYIDPDEDNALLHFRNALAIDPANGEARQGIDRLAEVLIARAESAMASRDYGGALRELEVARSLKPDHPRLAALDAQVGQRLQELSTAQIQAALQANAFDRATALIRQAERSGAVTPAQAAQLRGEIARRQASTELQDLARLAQARIAQGRLLEPANDSAKFYLARLQANGGDGADLAARLRQDYLRRLTADARAAAARGAGAEFETLAAELRANGVPAAQVAQLREAAAATAVPAAPRAPDGVRFAQLAQERLAQQRLLAPESDSALYYFRSLQAADARNPALPALRDSLGSALVEQARAAYDGGRPAEAQTALDAARDVGVPAATIAAVQAAGTAPRAPVIAQPPRLARALNPQYPSRAAQEGVEGWVDVEFSVNVEGEPENVRAIASEPARVFDAAAVAAVRRARFEPARTADGNPVAMNSRLRVRFAVQSDPKAR